MGIITPTLPPSSGSGGLSSAKENFDIASDVVANKITLSNAPATSSEMVAVNGLIMSVGNLLDYTILSNIITFNSGVLPSSGNITINYNY